MSFRKLHLFVATNMHLAKFWPEIQTFVLAEMTEFNLTRCFPGMDMAFYHNLHFLVIDCIQ